MLSLINMFGRSPFAPLNEHMNKVAACVEQVPLLFQAVQERDFEKIKELSQTISRLEHQADLAKNDIRNHLPKSLFLPIDRSWLLEVLEHQDKIADAVEDLAAVLEIRPLTFPPSFKKLFDPFLKKNLEAFYKVQEINAEFKELLETSFGGVEAEKVRQLVDEVALIEHEADKIQREVIKNIYSSEEKLTFMTFDLWKKIIELISSLSNLSEELANRVRMALDLK